MNLPNCLTISRFFLTIAFVVFIQLTEAWAAYLAVVVFTIGVFTDYLDGYIARKKNLYTSFGKIMDPVADKFLILSAFITFVQMGVLQAWMVVLIFIREVAVTFSRVARLRRGQVIAAEKSGKIKTVFQILCVSIVLIFLILEKSNFAQNWSQSVENGWGLVINILMFATVLLTVNSGVSYFLNLRKSASLS